MQRAFQGEPNPTLVDQGLMDFGRREMLTMAVMMLALIGLGIYPQPILDIAQPVLQSLLEVTP
jgi:NADH-quinone oxidoreductase subunit M